MIITPVLYKDDYYAEKPFKEIWSMTKEALSECKKLVIIGYSFSPTDFSTKQLLIESLKDNDLQELIVVNPDVSVVRITKELCHFNGGVVWYSDLNDYLQTFAGCVRLESKSLKIKEEDLPKDTTLHDLYLKCRTCGIEFRAGIRTNPRAYAISEYLGVVHTCPNGHTNSYDKKDYILKKIE